MGKVLSRVGDAYSVPEVVTKQVLPACAFTFAVLMHLPFLSATSAEDSPKFSSQPLVVLKSANWDEQSVFDYLRRVSEDLGVGQKVLAASQQNEVSEGKSSVRQPLSGTLVYLVPGLVPETATVNFVEIRDQAEFHRIVQYEKRNSGEQATLTGSGDTWTLNSVIVTRVPVPESDIRDGSVSVTTADLQKQLPEGQQPENDESPAASQPEQSLTIGFGASGSGIQFSSSRTDSHRVQDGEMTFDESTTRKTKHFRYCDGFLFQTTSDGLFSAELPSAESLRQLENADVHGELIFYPDRIPAGLKQMAWGAVSGAMGADLQQRDEEVQVDYDARRALGDAQLSTLQSLIFDIQRTAGCLKMGSGDEPLEGEFRVEARRNSSLSKSLHEMAEAESRFAPILGDDAAVTIHSAIMVPEPWQKVVLTTIPQLTSPSDSATTQEQLFARKLQTALQRTAESRTLEWFLKVVESESEGLMAWGAIQLHADDELAALAAQIVADESLKPDHGQDVVIYSHTDAEIGPFAIAFADQCFWMAAGQNSTDVLRRSIIKCRESAGRTRVPLLTLQADVVRINRILNHPKIEDAPTAVFLEEVMSAVESVTGTDPGEALSTILTDERMHQAANLGGPQDIRLVVESDSSGLVAGGSLGSATVRGIAAILLNVSEQSFSDAMSEMPEDAAEGNPE